MNPSDLGYLTSFHIIIHHIAKEFCVTQRILRSAIFFWDSMYLFYDFFVKTCQNKSKIRFMLFFKNVICRFILYLFGNFTQLQIIRISISYLYISEQYRLNMFYVMYMVCIFYQYNVIVLS